MLHILPEILSLIQYKNDVEHQSEEKSRPAQCENCGQLNLWCHGNYPRKSGRDDGDAAEMSRRERHH